MNECRIKLMLTCLLVLMAAQSSGDEGGPIEVDGVIGMTEVVEGSCIAVYTPLPDDLALAGVMWYNNDETVIFPQILVASGVAGYPEPIETAFPVATEVAGESSGWSTIVFSEPIVSIADGLYVVFLLPENGAHCGEGIGGGGGIGYTTGANGYTGWLSSEGEDWIRLHADYGIAVEPITVPATEDMVQKSLEDDEIPAVARTKLLNPAPNPFNPQTTLRFQLREASDVDLGIFNVRGERVTTVAAGVFSAGEHSVTWSGEDYSGRRLASGVYFVKFVAGSFEQTRRVCMLK